MKPKFLNNKTVKLFSVVVCCALFIFSCDTEVKKPTSEIAKTQKEKFIVKVSKTNFGDFNLEMKTKGKVFAQKKVDLKFKLDEKIARIYFNNGGKISKGNVIARQNSDIYKNKVVKAKEQLERAKIDVEDILIGFNYSLKDTSNIPKATLEMAKNRSNYNTAISNLNDAKIELASTVLKSPIKGIIANLDTKVYSYPDNSKPFCTIIDNSTLEVKFSVIEDDYIFLKKGHSLEISTLLNEETFTGKITEINPMVDENGMIKVKGIIKNVPDNIIDGMNVNVTVKKVISKKMFVPKQSVVLRNNKKVVFTYKEGKAIWNYVDTSFENYEYIVIESGLSKGDEVIYDGNINLANNSNVIKENE